MDSPPLLTPTRITSADDPRTADYRELRDRDLAARRDAFVVEGAFALGAMLAAGRFALRSVFVTDSRLPALAGLLLRVTAPIYTASLDLMRGIVGFPLHRGVLAIGERGRPHDAGALLEGLGPGPRTVLALCGVNNHDNIGGAFRNAAAFGVDAVLLDDVASDPLYRKAIRVSAGGVLTLPYARAGRALELVALCRRMGFATVALTPRAGARDLEDVLPELGARVAVCAGSEEPGLDPAVLAAADHAARIDIVPSFDSLNVATASGIALHAVRSRRRLARG
ncbi:MAG: RNA methyltransferase [Myxococcales bacterium]|nr:RNA methyltransferase [Myxococcales bacterium]